MIAERFYLFSLLIDGIHKCIHKIKIDVAPEFGVKSVHILWIYELRSHPEGLTAAELAAKSMISRSLVSRELEMLLRQGYVQIPTTGRGKRKNYNARITLTEKGEQLALSIAAAGCSVQSRVADGISEEELSAFYATLQKLYANLRQVADDYDGTEPAEKAVPSEVLAQTLETKSRG